MAQSMHEVPLFVKSATSSLRLKEKSNGYQDLYNPKRPEMRRINASFGFAALGSIE
jgi:hypothetical protein